MNPYITLALIILLATVLGLAATRFQGYEFVVRIGGGETRLVRGKVAAVFLQQVRELCERNRINRGWFGGVRKGRRISLQFGGGFPPRCQQQLRNLWGMQT